MGVRLLIAPAAAGKTEFALRHARHLAASLVTRPLLCVASEPQRRSAAQRLARMGGALGVSIVTFDSLFEEIHRHSGAVRQRLSDSGRGRHMLDLLLALQAAGTLPYYGPLIGMAGFTNRICALVDELRDALVVPDEFATMAHSASDAPRLVELATIYRMWQQRLEHHRLADGAEVRRLALVAIQEGSCLPNAATPLILDGFDDFSGVEIALLQALHRTVNVEVLITLTGDIEDRGSDPRRSVHRRFHDTRLSLESALSIESEAMAPAELRPASDWQPVLRHLGDNLLVHEPVSSVDAGEAVVMIEASSPSIEVREALRWLKERIVADGIAPVECAIVARNMYSYRALIDARARELGMPVRFEGGLPLAGNPVINAILRLLDAVRLDEQGSPTVWRRKVVGLLRSPYFDWQMLGFAAGDAALLETIARADTVIGGPGEWQDAVRGFAQRAEGATWSDESESAGPVVSAADAARLAGALVALVALLTPPPSASRAAYLSWLAARLGDAMPETLFDMSDGVGAVVGLRVRQQACTGEPDHVIRDLAALDEFECQIRNLAAAGNTVLAFNSFVDEVTRHVQVATYHPVPPDLDAITVASARQVRGLPFRAVALLGLAEGVMPVRLHEDPFLRNAEREMLRESHSRLAMPTDSAEQELLLEMLTQPTARLLITRPRLAEGGAPWEPSPFWQDIRACVQLEPKPVRSGRAVGAESAASLAELMQAAALDPDLSLVQTIETMRPGALASVSRAALIAEARARSRPSPFDGNLTAHRSDYEMRFGPSYLWSPSALETYLSCGFQYLTTRFLRLEAPTVPEEGWSGAIRGSLLHRILAETYRHADDRLDVESLHASLAEVGPRILDEAPRREGFRPPPGWRYVRGEIMETARNAIVALTEVEVVAVRHEVALGDVSPIRLEDNAGGSFVVRGRVDRIDTLPDGTLRLIDYKSGSAGTGEPGLVRGERIQLPLYAWALQQQETGATVSDGFYFILRDAEPGRLRLSQYAGGLVGAFQVAARYAWQSVRGVQSGDFTPSPPSGGCPEYCSAAAFCWHHRARSW